MFSHEDYINLVLETGQFVTHDYSHQSVQEDPRMMAFFDSLVQRDIEGWTSDSSDSVDGESSFYELCWNPPQHSDGSRSSNSSADESDNAETAGDLNSHYFKYLDVISKRIESNESNSNVNHSSTTQAESTTSNGTVSSSDLKDRLVNAKRIKTNENTLNRISELITEKKREQLRKLIKYAVRTTRKKLKRIERRSETKAKYDVTIEETETYRQRLSDLKKKLDFLAEKVTSETNGADFKPDRQTSNNHRNYRRLRFLTNQSDLVFNEVLPIVSSTSSSDSDDSNLVSGEELYNVISNEMSRMRSIINGDTDSSDSSSATSLLGVKTSSMTPNRANGKPSSSSDEEVSEQTDKQSNSQSKDDSKAKSANRVNFLSTMASNQLTDSDTDDETEANHLCDPVIHCPYKHDLCHSSTASTSTHNTNSETKKQVIFKPIDSRRRSYRKRKRSGNNRDKDKDESKDKDSESNANNDKNDCDDNND